ncbi:MULTISPECIES: FmdB family zinc ribbon protein [Anoxybacillus]|uniref:FmdB family zinc ribbon protein n=1 Tax=unclassified Anoxybacillus TaxID=2639704 RepID=UPI0004784E10|nr:hypothetical protein B379_04320 [Anoxybacillus ayderensis G10]MBW9219290.1 hypothetical protein [Anoxybacillus sp. ST70]NNU96294.1 hypothetical protein [Anoxybacillus sp. EFIL]
MKIAVHVYECKGCEVVFAVSQDFEEQHLVQCPICKSDKALKGLSDGELRMKRGQQLRAFITL